MVHDITEQCRDQNFKEHGDSRRTKLGRLIPGEVQVDGAPPFMQAYMKESFQYAPVLLLRDADRSTPLHVAVQNADTAIAEVLLEHSPMQPLYTENNVGKTPLDIASLKGPPRRVTSSMEIPRATELLMNSPSFDVEKQKAEIPKLRATLDTLLTDGLRADGSKVTTELLAFTGRMEEGLTVETASAW
ncbi:hypothetical protein H4582DRAFT_2131307 [Lactarius indigo]|nr:hypothetical protein H4582DRAFT_2131307 [Lactarius indigo]